MAHALHVIGWMGSKRAYLDISPEEAARRYAASEPEHVEEFGMPQIQTFHFVDEFLTYDAEPLPDPKSP